MLQRSIKGEKSWRSYENSVRISTISVRKSVITGVKFCEVRNCWSCCCCCCCSRRSCFCCSDRREDLKRKQRHTVTLHARQCTTTQAYQSKQL